MITCDACGKVNGEGDIGEHWICDSCKVPEPADDKKKAEDGNKEHEHNHKHS
ncbi:hypothetical protein [Paenibacillus mesotrionivorans]|jgi:hypothetical protein|uniref:Uncharacterized protein n=1 Tax=Paenibacillus mesotrionivorans TaxID=3160968 RepID=A0ACC7NS85_9BACL